MGPAMLSTSVPNRVVAIVDENGKPMVKLDNRNVSIAEYSEFGIFRDR